MNPDARTVVNRLILELVQRPSRQLELRGEEAHPLLIERLRHMARMEESEDAGKIEVEINHVPWNIDVAISSGFLGEQARLTARERKNSSGSVNS